MKKPSSKNTQSFYLEPSVVKAIKDRAVRDYNGNASAYIKALVIRDFATTVRVAAE